MKGLWKIVAKKKKIEENSQFRQLTIWDVIQQFDRQAYTVKSLFSGAGGLDYGFEQAGLRVVESYEFESNACATLAKSGKSNVYKCDISKLLLENQLRTYIITEAFVIENVPAMRKHAVVMEAFMEMPGYHVSQFILNAANCGAPQNRKRLIIIGSKKPFEWDFSPVPENPVHTLFSLIRGKISL